MISEDQAYVIAYDEAGSSVDGWASSQISAGGPGRGGPLDETPIPAPTVWSISLFDDDGNTLASVQVDAQTGAVP